MASSDKGSTYGKGPLYYGSAKNSPVYYGKSQVPYYGGGAARAPYYYGGSSYGEGQPNSDDSLVGTVTIGRIFRVMAQRWISILVFLLIGLVAAFAVYRISPTIFEATSEFTMDTRRPQNKGGVVTGMDMEAYGSSYEEIFNTRLSDWRSDKIVTKIVQQYRANYPASTVTDSELISTLGDSRIELVRHSRLITIDVRSRTAALAAALANAYAEAIEAFTDEENKLRCDKAVAQIHEQVEKQRRADEKIAKNLLDFRTVNKIDNMHSEREILQQTLVRTTTDILELESQITKAAEWEKVLEAAQETPERFGDLPTEVPRSSEIGTSYTTWQTARGDLDGMLQRFTKNHPEVRVKEQEVTRFKEEFVAAVQRALATAHGTVVAYRNQNTVYKKTRERVRAEIAQIEGKIVAAEAGLKKFEQEKDVSSSLYKDLLQKENESRIAAEQNNEIVRVGRPAIVPSKPVLPNPVIIFSAGAAVSLALGIVFVLVLDHLEDTIVSLNDIETRLALKVLVVLPHVRRKKREQVAKFISENKYSQFAESMAGLRNLLDSPRYQAASQAVLLMSTQPGEGKTITSCSLAISSAQAGKRTLLVDFDLRRPRLARVWELTLDRDHSFSHQLSRTDGTIDFASLVNKSSVENLDIIASLVPDDVNPASIMGSKVVPDFFAWARANYDRIVIDSPPYGIVGDVMTLGSMVDAVMIMCCPDRTHFKPIQHAARSLTESGATVIGVVVNDVEMGATSSAFTPASQSYSYRYYGGYRSYGYGNDNGYGPYAPKNAGKRKSSKKDKTEGATPAADGAEAAPADAQAAEAPTAETVAAVEPKHHAHEHSADSDVADEA